MKRVGNAALQVPPLVRHPESKALLVNLDPCIYQVIQESVCMTKMKLAVPRDAQLLLYSKQKLRRQHSLLLQVLRDNADIRAKIDDIAQPLFNTSLKKVSSTTRLLSNESITFCTLYSSRPTYLFSALHAHHFTRRPQL